MIISMFLGRIILQFDGLKLSNQRQNLVINKCTTQSQRNRNTIRDIQCPKIVWPMGEWVPEASKCCSSNSYVLYVLMSEPTSHNVQGRMQEADWTIPWLLLTSEKFANYQDPAAFYCIEQGWGRRGCILQTATASANYTLTKLSPLLTRLFINSKIVT
jgi:hypothetical protein